MASKTIAELLAELDAATTGIATRFQALLDKIQSGDALTEDEITAFQADVDHLNALGADPAPPAAPPAS